MTIDRYESDSLLGSRLTLLSNISTIPTVGAIDPPPQTTPACKSPPRRGALQGGVGTHHN
jgi:hypothetical protein